MATSDLAGLLSTAPTLSAHGAGSVGIITKETLQCLAQQRHALALTAAAAEQQANGVACLSGRQVTYAAPAAANAAAVHRYVCSFRFLVLHCSLYNYLCCNWH